MPEQNPGTFTARNYNQLALTLDYNELPVEVFEGETGRNQQAEETLHTEEQNIFARKQDEVGENLFSELHARQSSSREP